jgi:chromosome segregation ATPase
MRRTNEQLEAEIIKYQLTLRDTRSIIKELHATIDNQKLTIDALQEQIDEANHETCGKCWNKEICEVYEQSTCPGFRG